MGWKAAPPGVLRLSSWKRKSRAQEDSTESTQEHSQLRYPLLRSRCGA